RDHSDHRVVVAALAGPADPRHPAGLPRHLLLLPQGLLPLLLLVTAGLRDPGCPQKLQRRDPLPVPAPEHPPLLLLVVNRDRGLPVVGRAQGVQLSRRLGHRLGHSGADRERRPALAVYPLLSLLPPPVRRLPRHLQAGAEPLPAVAAGQPAERAPRTVRL